MTKGRAVSGVDAEGADVIDRVRAMYRDHPFPPPQRKNSYRSHARYVRGFLESQGLRTAGAHFGDIACGTGLMMLDYCQEFPEAKVTGLDLSDVSVGRANATLQEHGCSNGTCYTQDIMGLDLVSEFDYLVSWGTVHHLSDPRQGLQNLANAVRPGGLLRLGVYGYYGNWERRIRRELATTLGSSVHPDDIAAQARLVSDWAKSDDEFRNFRTAPPVDFEDTDWVVDELLHVWEKHLHFKDVAMWLQESGLELLRLTDYNDQEISLNVADHSNASVVVDNAERLPFIERCNLIDLLVRPYWISALARKPS